MSLNKLSSEKSAYLLQHAENPIHWQAYNKEALDKAKELNRPILLSIGYSSCHWCHVMAHESFEDQETANFLNSHFVSIKVDREEHPHLDHLYQNVAAASGGRGGWPLNVFLTPGEKPIFVGTYFPLKSLKGATAFMDVLRHIQTLYKDKGAELEKQGSELLAEIAKPLTLEREVKFNGHFPTPAAIMHALQNYADKTNGGYGQAPKFPNFAFLEWAAEQILEGMIPQELGQHLVDTVEKMLMGGTFDHLKGGIHRYSTDAGWVVPHFEKMLYDQAGLLRVLAKVTAFYPSPLLFDAMVQTMDYLNTEMISENGYFMSAQDADSEEQEGLYFTFSKEEFVNTLQDSAPLGTYDPTWEKWFRITEKGNFHQGLSVISLDPAFKDDYYIPEGWDKVRRIRQALLEERKRRIPPATDPKGVASWNYQILSALCDVIQYCRVPVIAQQGAALLNRVLEGVSKTFIGKDEKGRNVLNHTTSTVNTPSYLEDYASFIDAQLRLYEVTGTEVFRTNAQETLAHVKRAFFQDGDPRLVAGYEGGEWRAPLNDQSFRSSLGTLMLTTARISLLDSQFEPSAFWGDNWQKWTQHALVSPIAHGEALRAYSYPLEIIRKVEVPRKWVNEGNFQQLRSYFLGRFVICYHDREDESWQVCNRKECEQTGKGFQDLQTVFKPVEAQQQ